MGGGLSGRPPCRGGVQPPPAGGGGVTGMFPGGNRTTSVGCGYHRQIPTSLMICFLDETFGAMTKWEPSENFVWPRGPQNIRGTRGMGVANLKRLEVNAHPHAPPKRSVCFWKGLAGVGRVGPPHGLLLLVNPPRQRGILLARTFFKKNFLRGDPARCQKKADR